MTFIPRPSFYNFQKYMHGNFRDDFFSDQFDHTAIIDHVKNLPFKKRAFNDPEVMNKWISEGYKEENIGGLLYDERDQLPEWAVDLKEQLGSFFYFSALNDLSIAFFKMEPCSVVPTHVDTFSRYKEIHKNAESDNIIRSVIFVEEWQSGHYFEVDGKPIVQWSQSHVCMIKPNVPHMAANFGAKPRYTIQLTGWHES